jgi:hypothetical protein
MKKFELIVILLAFTAICCSCSTEEEGAGLYIVNKTDVPITLYSESDSIMTYSQERTHISNVAVYDRKIVSWKDTQWDFVLRHPIKKIRIAGELYEMPKQYEYALVDLNNYQYYYIVRDCVSSAGKIVNHYYEYYLTAELVDEIINAAEE